MNDSTAVMQTIDAGTLAKYVRFLVGSFRLGEAEDGEVLTRGLTALLGSYPEFVVRAVCDPRSGLPAKSKFFPTLYEVRSACEAKLRPLLDEERRRRLEAEREADTPAPIDDLARERRKAVVAQWRAKEILRAAAADGQETPLEQMDVRGLKGEHRVMVQKALDGKIERLREEFSANPPKLSDLALRTQAGRPPLANQDAV